MYISTVTKPSGSRISDTYNGRSKRTVQPPTPLTNELRSRLRHIRLGFTGFDVRQCPPLVSLGDELETEDTILSQEHVLREDVHAIDTLRAEPISQRVVTVEVLLEGTAEDSTIPVRRESTGQHRDVAETTL